MYEILTGTRPFSEFTSPKQIKEEIITKHYRPPFLRAINKTYKELIERCWSEDPTKRPTFDEIVYELKTNPNFITDAIEEDSYFEYIKYLDEYQVSFDTTKRIKLFDDLISSKLHTFEESDNYSCIENMYDTETIDLFLDINCFNYDEYSLDLYRIDFKIEPIENWSKNEFINLSRQINISSRLNHPVILKYIGYSETKLSNYLPMIAYERASKMNLHEFIQNSKIKTKQKYKKWNDTTKLINIFGIASAMAYLHSYDIIHRDLKTTNVYNDNNLLPKLSGFDISKFITNKTEEKSETIKGTPAYLAPEIYTDKIYSKSSDVYAFSYIMYEILTGTRPFSEFTSPKQIKEEIITKHYRPPFLRAINKTYKELIERCWSEDPTKRPTFDEIVYELKTNPNFITENVNREEFYKYIKIIEESPVSFKENMPITRFNHNIKTPNTYKQEYELKINIFNIYTTEFYGVHVEYDFLDLNNFKKERLINRERSYKLYIISNKKTNTMYLTKKLNDFDEYVAFQIQELLKNINNILSLNHPCILNFIGYSPISFKYKDRKMIVSEYGINGSLHSILELDMKNPSNLILNETKRLIIIYGIATAMSYIHSQNLIHSELRTKNIYLDEFLFPKINVLNLSDKISENPIFEVPQDYISKIATINHFNQSIYYSPERYFYQNKHSSAEDVYSFSIIVYQLIANKYPTLENFKPTFDEEFPESFKKLIEKCCSNDPKERPTFDEIVYHLKTDPEIINNNVCKEEYHNYINFLEKWQTTERKFHFDDFIKTKNTTFRKVQIDFKKIRDSKRLNFSLNIGSININKYQKQKKIGEGCFGVVYKINQKDTDKLYAAKVSIYEMDQCENDVILNLSREIEIISKLNHLSILKYVGFSPYDFKNRSKPVIITEYSSNGSLDKILESERLGYADYNWNDTKKLINVYGIAAGLAHMHEKNILHRDLKPANILLDDNLYPKIADFGLSKIMNEQDKIEIRRKNPITSGFKGTYAYCAPEIINKQIYTSYGDVYAYGMIVYEIITGEIPFNNFDRYQLLIKVSNGYRPPFKYTIPYCYRKLINECWQSDYKRRPSFKEIVKNLETNKNFITDNIDEDEYLDYISLLKEQNDQQSKQQKVDKNNENVKKVSSNLNKKRIIEIEKVQEDNLKNEYFLDLSKYERQEIISKGDSSKFYKFKEIETGLFYSGQISMQKINKLNKEEIESLTKEIQILKEMNHPSILKFIGYSPINFKKENKPIIVTEYTSNLSLDNILEIERMNKTIPGWNETKKLMNIFGIASGMSYLHSFEIIHRSLKPSSIYLDEILTPKIGDFGLSTKFNNSKIITHQSISGIKATPIYSAPEVLQSNEYTKSSDVYAFSFIVYEIMTNEIPFNEIKNQNLIFNEVLIHQNRPKFNKKIPQVYQNLIERCWSQNSNERPSFDEIVYILKNDSRFITENVCNEDYQKYIKFIEGQIKTQEKQQKIIENESITKHDQKELLIQHKKNAEKGELESIEFLAKYYTIENDTENIYKYFCMLIKKGNCTIPLEYANNLFKEKYFNQAFNYFSIISESNNPIANYFIGIMKFYGFGCKKDQKESFKILKYLSDNGIDRASDFIENHFD